MVHHTEIEGAYWFPAKRYGWGWGLPCAWQGWLVLAVYAVLILVGAFLFPPVAQHYSFIACVTGLTAVLVLVCWVKGEPPGWRWGWND